MRHRSRHIWVILIATAALLAPMPASGQTCGQVCQLKRQNATLQKQVKTLRGQRDLARAELSQAQSSVAGAIGTMAPAQVWPLMQEIAHIFSTPQYSNSYFSSADNYESWTFTRCGFC